MGKGTLYTDCKFLADIDRIGCSSSQCVLITTLPASATEIGIIEIGQQILSSLENRIIVRVGTGIKPVDDEKSLKWFAVAYL